MAQGRAKDAKAEQARREKIAAARRGKKHSKETRGKIAHAANIREMLKKEERLDAFAELLDRDLGGDPWELPEAVRRKRYPDHRPRKKRG